MFAKAIKPAQEGMVIMVSLSAGEVKELLETEVLDEVKDGPLDALDRLGNRVIEQLKYTDEKMKSRQNRIVEVK